MDGQRPIACLTIRIPFPDVNFFDGKYQPFFFGEPAEKQ